MQKSKHSRSFSSPNACHSGTGFAGEKAWTPPPEVVTIFSLMAIAGNPQGEVFVLLIDDLEGLLAG